MQLIRLLLLVFAIVLAVVASFWNPSPRVGLGWLSLACFAAAELLTVAV